jgi:DNA-binding IclR family transcriptional regulator
MPRHTRFFTKALTNIISAIELIASPEGSTIMELAKSLSLTRRSVFRLLRSIEHDLNIPILTDRKAFGGVATYRLAPESLERLSQVATSSVILSFRQKILFYLILKDDFFQNKH